MLKWIFSTLGFIFFLSASVLAEAGNLFVVSSSGTGNNISITLCLNVNGPLPLSCQDYTTKPGTLTIYTTTPNHAYQSAGIKINSTGYAYSSSPQANGYSFIGAVSNTQAATGAVRPTSSTLSTTNPSSIAVDSGQTATFSTTASGGVAPYSYQWQLSTNGGTNFNNISSANASSYTTGALSTVNNGYQYHVVVTDAASDSVTSGPAILTVNNLLSATVTPSSLNVNSGQTANFTANPAGGIAPYRYQWYSCTDSTCASATAISGATSSTYSPSTAATGAYYYEAIVTDSAPTPETATTNVATLTVNDAFSATVTPSSLNVNSGQTANFTANPTGGTASYNYQWYSCTDSTCASATAILGATSNTYSPSTATTGTYYYQAIVTDSASTPQAATTNVATLSINDAFSATVTPSDLSVDSGQTANFTANSVGGTAPYSYQWYSCTDSTCASPTIISGATSNTYSPSTATTGAYYYQAIVTDSASTPETATTNVATLTVNGALSATVSPSSLSVYTNQTANFTANPTGGVSPYSYQWYSCTDSSCASATIISGATSSTYSPSTTTTGTYYYQAVVMDSVSSPETATTDVATLTVNSLPHIIFVTTDTYTGNLGGLSGANQKCNLDPGKPGGFALDYNYKALLNGNNATVSGTPYYRTDGITLIATATTGGNLVGLSSLTHSIAASGSLTVWTGANGNSCSNWTSTTTTGDRGAASSPTTQYWFAGITTCSTARTLYCVSQ